MPVFFSFIVEHAYLVYMSQLCFVVVVVVLGYSYIVNVLPKRLIK